MKNLLLAFILGMLSMYKLCAQDLVSCLAEKIEYMALGEEDMLKEMSKQSLQHFTNKNFILSGEIHTIWKSEDLRFSFLRALNKGFGINHLILEEGLSVGYLINRFLITGDESYLEKIYPSSENPVIDERNIKRKENLKKVYKENHETTNKIKVIGLDIERFEYKNVSIVLKELVNEFTIPTISKTLLKDLSIGLEENIQEKEIENLLLMIFSDPEIKNLLLSIDSYEEWVLNGVLKGLLFYVTNKSFRQRDEYMYKRFIEYQKIDKHREINKYYFQIGVNHLKTKNDWFASYVLSKEAKKENLISLLIRFEYFGFEKNIFGTSFKKNELSSYRLKSKELDRILKDNKSGMIRLNACMDSQIDYSFFVRR